VRALAKHSSCSHRRREQEDAWHLHCFYSRRTCILSGQILKEMATKKYIRHKPLALGVLCFLCLFVAAEPFRIANASLTKSGTMPCCAGKAGHCDSGLKSKKVPPPKSEPMCGLHGARMESDGFTIVAEPIAEPQHSHSQHVESSSSGAETSTSGPAVESPSLNRPCHQECGSCAAVSTRQQKRDRGIVAAAVFQNVSLITPPSFQTESLLFSSNENWSEINPRGPPARR